MRKNKIISAILLATMITSSITYVATAETSVKTIFGNNRYETAIKVLENGWKSGDTNTIIITTGKNVVDGLGATPLATICNSPILLCDENGLTKEAYEKIKELGSIKNAYLIGGNNAVPTKVEEQLKTLKIKSKRLEGENRFETSVSIGNEINNLLKKENKTVDKVAVVNGNLGIADAISIATIAGKEKMPIILCEKEYIPSVSLDFINKLNIKNSYVIGGQGIIEDTVTTGLKKLTKGDVERLGGLNRYETNDRIISRFYQQEDLKNIYVTTGDTLFDALTIAPLASKEDKSGPVLLVGQNYYQYQKSFLKKKACDNFYQVGGNVNKEIVDEMSKDLGKID